MFQASSYSLSEAEGARATLSWQSTNATVCRGNDFETTGNTSGSVTVFPRETTVYTLECQGPGGTARKSITISVPALPLPQIGFHASTTFPGTSSMLTWLSKDATRCEGINFQTGGKTSGEVKVEQEETTTYSITCDGPGGSKTGHITIEVSKLEPKVYLQATQSEEGVVLSWSARDVEECEIRGTGGFSYSTTSLSGTITTTSAQKKTSYTITCTTGE